MRRSFAAFLNFLSVATSSIASVRSAREGLYRSICRRHAVPRERLLGAEPSTGQNNRRRRQRFVLVTQAMRNFRGIPCMMWVVCMRGGEVVRRDADVTTATPHHTHDTCPTEGGMEHNSTQRTLQLRSQKPVLNWRKCGEGSGSGRGGLTVRLFESAVQLPPVRLETKAGRGRRRRRLAL